MAKQARKLIANNKKVYHDYFLEETFEAGIALAGTEVKSMRMGKCSIKESFIHIENGEVILYGMHISPYEKGNIFNKDPLRPRKLLMHKKEIQKLVGKIAQKGYTIVTLKSDNDMKLRYYKALESSHTEQQHDDFYLLVAETEKASLERYISILG